MSTAPAPKILLDTVGLIALWDESDQWHVAAANAFAELQNRPVSLLTTTYVLLEAGNAAARRPYRDAVVRLHKSLAALGLLVSPTDDDWLRAWAAYECTDADHAGIVDCVSFEVMRRMQISHAFTNDRHFRAAGFQTMF